MELIQQFKNYLISGRNAASKATVKNYVADVKKFISWFEKTTSQIFIPQHVSEASITEYKKAQSSLLSARSMERQMSSLKKFFEFMKLEGYIGANPFDLLNAKPVIADPWHFKQFKDFLYVYNASHLTIKNYVIDVKQFFAWVEQVAGTTQVAGQDNNILSRVDDKIIEEYRDRLLEEGSFSPASINRKLSSLRKYLTWAHDQGYLSNTLRTLPANVTPPLPTEAVKSGLSQDLSSGLGGVTRLGAPQEVPASDQVNEDILGGEEGQAPTETQVASVSTLTPTLSQEEREIKEKNTKYSKIPPVRLFQKLLLLASLGLEYAVVVPVAHATAHLRHQVWILKGKPLFVPSTISLPSKLLPFKSHVKNLSKSFYNPLGISITHFPLHKKLLYHMQYTRPAWYRRYSRLSAARYFNLAILMIFCAMIGFGLYSSFFSNARRNPTLAALPTAPPRVLSFQGRLTDNSDNPITTANTHLRFAIYNDVTATGGALLWQEVNDVDPDSDGDFATLLGSKTTIPQSLFAQNNALWLGVTVETTDELQPRQQIATVAFATNSETLQGLPPITQLGAGTQNVVLALDSSGNLGIAASTTFQSTTGQFTLSGNTLVLNTNTGSNGSIAIAPDGYGTIDLQKPVQNTSLNNNIPSAAGSVEIDDLLSVLATSSGQSAFTINQNSTGPLISASTSGIAKFTVDNSGNVYAAGNVTGQTIYAGGGTSYYINSTTSNLNSLTLASNLTVSGNVSSHLIPSVTDTFDLGSPSLEWRNLYVQNIIAPSSGGTSGYWQLNAGALSPTNITNDVLVGGISTPSAKFQIFSQTGNATTAGTLTFRSNGTIQTTSMLPLVLGSSSTGSIQLSPKGTTGLFVDGTGNVGIGTLAPTQKLDVSGSIQATSIFDLQNNTYFLDPSAATSIRVAGNVGIGGANPTSFTLQSAGHVGPDTTNTYDLGSLSLEWRNIYGQHVFANGIEVNQYLQRNAGVISPLNITDDFAIGGTATSTAKFQVFGLTGNATTAGTLTFTSSPVIQTTSMQTLTLGGASTGSVQLSPKGTIGLFVDGTGNVGIGTTSPVAPLEVAGSANANVFADRDNTSYFLNPAATTTSLLLAGSQGIGTLTPLANTGLDIEKNGLGNSVLAVNQSGSGDILTASASGVSTFTIANDGTIKNSLNPNQNNTYDLGTLSLQWNNIFANNIYSNGVLLTANLWQQILGVLSPTNNTNDLAIGGNSTASAKFQIFGLTGNATTAGNLTFGGTSATNVIAARSNAGLTIGDSQTGPIKLGTLESGQTLTLGNATGTNIINGSNFSVTSSGNITAATINSLNGLSVSGSTQTLTANNLSDSGALTVATGANGNITLTPNGVGTVVINPNAGGQSSLIINNRGTGDLFTASASGTTRFTIANNGTIKNSLLPNATNTYDLGSLALQWNNVYGQHIFSNGTELTQYWQRNSGALSPFFVTDDLLLGATATSGAKFAITNIAGGTPIASLSAGLNSGLSIDASGNIQTYAAQSLTLGGIKTGNINLGSDATARAIAIGNATGATSVALQAGTGNFTVSGAVTTTYTIGTTTGTGLITLGQSTAGQNINIGNSINTSAQQIQIGNGASAANSEVDILSGVGTAGTSTLRLGNNTRVSTIDIGNIAPALTRNINIAGGNAAGDDNVNILTGAPSAGNQAVNILTGNATGGVQTLNLATGTTAKLVNIGGTGNNTIALGNTQSGGTISIGNALTTGTVSIGGTGLQTGSITIGDGTGNQSIDLGNGSGNKTINIGGSGTNTINIGSSQTNGNINIGVAGSTTTIKGTNFTIGGIAYGDGTNTLAFTSSGASNQCLLSNGTGAPTWGLCTFGNSNYWNVQQGALFPINATLDFLIGATAGASSSAKFAVLNVASGTPIASVSAGTNSSAMSIDADGNLQTAQMHTLTVGGDTTGNIIIKPQNGTGTGTITFSGYTTGILHSNVNGLITSTTVDLQNDISNTLRVDHGGTGLTSLALGSLVYGGGGVTMSPLAIGNTNDSLSVVGGVPVWSPYATHSALFVTNNAQLNTVSSLTNAILPTTNGTLDLGNGSHYFGTIYANNVVIPVGNGISGFWQLNSNVISPINNTYDLAIGGSATGSATPWQVFGTTVGVNTAGTASSSGNLAFRGASTEIDLLNGSGLDIKASVGGNAGLTSISTLTSAGALTLASNLAVNGTSITTTSTSSFSLLNTNLTGTLNFAGQVGTFNIANNSTNTQFNGNITLGNDVNSKTVSFNSKIASDIYPNSNATYSLGSSTNYWQNVYTNNTFGSAVSGTQGYWQVNNNVISPAFNWQSLAIGGTASFSAAFQVFGGQYTNNSTLNSGIIPSGTASTSGGFTFRGTATNVALLNNSSFGFYTSVGGDVGLTTTPSLFIANRGNSGFVGIGTTVPLTALQIAGSASISANLSFYGASTAHTLNLLDGGTFNFQRSIGGDSNFATTLFLASTGSIGIGTTNPLSQVGLDIERNGLGNSALVVNQLGLGDIFSASTAGVPKFTIANDGTIKNHLIPNITDTYNLGSDPSLGGKEWDTLYVRQVVTPTGNLGGNYWQLSNTGTLAPINANYDLVIGGNSTASAKFQVLGGSVNGGSTTITTSSVTGTPLAIFANSLTTGTVATISATALTSGNLLSLLGPNPSATVSATAFTGSLINVASANHTYMTLNNSDLTIGGHKNNVVIANVAKVFVYDTSNDSDGGRWTNDERAQGSSWYNETLNTGPRGSTRPFPRKAIIVIANNGNPTADMYIYDAKDNSLWMSFTKGSGAGSFMIGSTSAGTLTSVTALNGEIYLASSGVGLITIDFKQDTSNLMVAGAYKKGANVIANRNTGNNYFTFNSLVNFSLASVTINDVAVNIINGQTYIAAGTRGSASSGGVSLLNESTLSKVTTFGPVNGLTSNVALTSTGDLYATVCSDTSNPCGKYVLKVKHNVQSISSSSSTALYDEVYGWVSNSNYGVATTDNNTFGSITFGRGPSASTSANLSIPIANGLYVTQGTSTADGISNTIYLGENGSDGALAAIQENQASPSAGIIKYYKKNFITDDIVGDTRAFFPLNEASGSVTDAGPMGNVLTASSSGVTYGVSGVRGTAVSLNGTTGFLWCSNFNCGGVGDLGVSGASQRLSLGAWIKTSANPAQQIIMSKFNSGVTGTYALSLVTGGIARLTINGLSLNLDSTRSVNDGNWHYVVGTYDGTNARVFIDGQLDAMLPKTGSFSNDTNDFILGAWKVTNSYANWFSGTIDEAFVSASALTASEITHNYQVGYRALQNHNSQSIRGTTIAGDASQQLPNSNGNVNAVAASMRNGMVYTGTSNGGISLIGMDTDSVKDVYNSAMTTTDDQGNSWTSNNDYSSSISLGQSYGTGTLMAFGSNNAGAGKIWMESQDTTFKDFLASSYNPFGATLNQTNINVDGIFRVTNQLSTRLDDMAYLATSSASLDLFQIDNNGRILSQQVKDSTTAVQFNDSAGNNELVIDTVNDKVGMKYLYDLDNSAYFMDPAATGTSLTVAGNVGIGTTSPNSLLHVKASGSNSGVIEIDNSSNATAQTKIVFDDNGGANTFQIGKQTDNSFFMYDNAHSRDFLDLNTSGHLILEPSGGNVGIGTSTTTLGTFTVNGSGAFISSVVAYDSTSNNYAASLQYNASSVGSISPFTNYTRIRLGGNTGPTLFGITDFDTKWLMSINRSSGNVGIASGSASQLFEVAPPSNAAATIGLASTGGAGDWIKFGVSGTYTGKAAIGYNQITSGALEFFTGGFTSSENRMNISSGGNVGIGMVADSIGAAQNYSLQVNRGATGSIYLHGTDANIAAWDGVGGHIMAELHYSSANTKWYWHDISNNSDRISFQANTGAIISRSTITASQGAVDYAENIHNYDGAQPGDILAADPNATNSGHLTTTPYDPSLIGAVSTHPGFLIVGDTTNSYVNDENFSPEGSVPLALAGRVPTKVTTKNGIIKIGDHITSSNLSGVGMKATQAGMVVGEALESFDPNTRTCTQVASLDAIVWPQDPIGFNNIPTCYQLPDGTYVGKVMALVKPNWYDPDVYLTSTGEIQINNSTNSTDFSIPHYYTLSDAVGNPITRMGAFLELVVGNLRVGNISAQQIFTNSLAIATDKISIGGQSLHDYIAGIVNQVLATNDQGLATNTDTIHTNLISPLSPMSDLSLELNNSRISVKNTTTGAVVASIDDAGNASFSGTLNSQNLAINGDATVSGTLHADRIEANSIVGLSAAVGTLSAQNITNVTNIYFASPSGTQGGENNTPGSSGSGNNNNGLPASPQGGLAQSGDFVDIASYSAYFAYVPNLRATTGIFKEGLISLGPASFTDTSIAGSLTIGNYMSLADTSINVLGADLQIQPLRQGGIAFAGDEIHIDANGNLRVNGSAVFNGNIAINTLSPTGPDKDINVILGSKPTNQFGPGTNSDENSQHFRIQNASGSGVLSINQFGDLIASGAATIAKLNFTGAQPAFAVSATEQIATSSAGTAQIGAHQTEMTIDNTRVTANSLIYITPVGSNTAIPYLLRQVAGTSFTVGIQAAQLTPVTFNWLIVN